MWGRKYCGKIGYDDGSTTGNKGSRYVFDETPSS